MGRKANGLPAEQPRKLGVVINLKNAK